MESVVNSNSSENQLLNRLIAQIEDKTEITQLIIGWKISGELFDHLRNTLVGGSSRMKWRKKKISQLHGEKLVFVREIFNLFAIIHPSVGHLIFLCCLVRLFHYAHFEANWIYLKMTAHRVKCKSTKFLRQWRPNHARRQFIFIIQYLNGKTRNREKKVGVYSKNRTDEQIRSIRMKTLLFSYNLDLFHVFCFLFFVGSRAYGLLDMLSNWNHQIFVSSFALHPT